MVSHPNIHKKNGLKSEIPLLSNKRKLIIDITWVNIKIIMLNEESKYPSHHTKRMISFIQHLRKMHINPP